MSAEGHSRGWHAKRPLSDEYEAASEPFTKRDFHPAESTTAAPDFVDPITLRRLFSIPKASTSRQLGGLYEDCAFGRPQHLLSSPATL
jgi:hypothetical protein